MHPITPSQRFPERIPRPAKAIKNPLAEVIGTGNEIEPLVRNAGNPGRMNSQQQTALLNAHFGKAHFKLALLLICVTSHFMNEILEAQHQALAQAQQAMQQNTQLISESINKSLPELWWMGLKLYFPFIIMFWAGVWIVIAKLSRVIEAIRLSGLDSGPHREQPRPSLKRSIW